MKFFKSSLAVGFVLFFITGVAGAVEMDDLAITIRVIEKDDVNEVANELSLPTSIVDDARQQGDVKEQKDSAHDETHTDESKLDMERQETEDQVRDDSERDQEDRVEEHHDAEEEEQHDKEHDVNIGG